LGAVQEVTPDRIAIVKVSLFPGRIGIDFANALSHLFCDRLAALKAWCWIFVEILAGGLAIYD
jgi:hypothetical protein